MKNYIHHIVLTVRDAKRSTDWCEKVLGGKIIELNNHGHYTMEDMGTEEFPELLDIILD